MKKGWRKSFLVPSKKREDEEKEENNLPWRGEWEENGSFELESNY